jgi:hypothetical protein
MELLILVAAAGVIGYFFARSRYSKHVDNAAESVTTTSKDYAGQAGSWWQRTIGRGKDADTFQTWVNGPGASALPDEFKTWFTSLSEQDISEFTHALDGYLKGLGYQLTKLVDGSLEGQPALLQAYVEAVVVYSDAFRKAKEASQADEADQEDTSEDTSSSDGKKPAQKTTSRRKGNSSESASAA